MLQGKDCRSCGTGWVLMSPRRRYHMQRRRLGSSVTQQSRGVADPRMDQPLALLD
jgi:hypothetical protein